MKKIQYFLYVSSILCFCSSLHAMTSNQDKIQSAFKNIVLNSSDQESYEVTVMNESFLASKNVFSPKYFKSTEMLTSHFPFKQNETFLEIGCGIGVASIIAAKNFGNKVVAVDINPAAVQMTTQNALKHGVSLVVDARESDVFSAIHTNEKFNTIYWDLPYVYTDVKEDKNLSMLQRSVSDPGYQHIESFLAQAPRFLMPNGRIVIGFGSNGDYEKFSELLEKYHYKMTKIYEGYNPYRKGITYQLYGLSFKGGKIKDYTAFSLK